MNFFLGRWIAFLVGVSIILFLLFLRGLPVLVFLKFIPMFLLMWLAVIIIVASITKD